MKKILESLVNLATKLVDLMEEVAERIDDFEELKKS